MRSASAASSARRAAELDARDRAAPSSRSRRWPSSQSSRPSHTSPRTDDPGLYLYTLATDSYERLTDFGVHPRWLEDNRKLLFYHQGTRNDG